MSEQTENFTMMIQSQKLILLTALSLLLLACDKPSDDQAAAPIVSAPIEVPDLAPRAPAMPKQVSVQRTYSAEQLRAGLQIYQANCQICHGEEGVGEAKEWQNAREDGTAYAPPLNGSAHTWHHNQEILLSTIDRGGIPLGGRMPAFKQLLSEQDKLAVLAYIQSLWPDKIYQIWSKNNAQN